MPTEKTEAPAPVMQLGELQATVSEFQKQGMDLDRLDAFLASGEGKAKILEGLRAKNPGVDGNKAIEELRSYISEMRTEMGKKKTWGQWFKEIPGKVVEGVKEGGRMLGRAVSSSFNFMRRHPVLTAVVVVTVLSVAAWYFGLLPGWPEAAQVEATAGVDKATGTTVTETVKSVATSPRVGDLGATTGEVAKKAADYAGEAPKIFGRR